ncbi:hypothetical protein HK405_006232, partial [Cladochytrium tenue]
METYLLENTYETIYFRISKEFTEADQQLADAVSEIECLDLYQLGLAYSFGPRLLRAVKEFQRIQVLRTPFEKIGCLMRSIRLLSKSPSGASDGAALSSDVIVPLLVLMVVRSRAQNLQSSLYFMQQFTFEHDVVSGEYGFALSSLEAVIAYVLDNAATFSRVSNIHREAMEAARTGEVSNLQRLFAQADAEKDNPEGLDLGSLRSWEGCTLLMLAVENRQPNAVGFLLDHGFDPSSQNFSNQAQLHICARDGLTDIAATLLARGATVDPRDTDGNTPFLVALQHGHDGIRDLLATPPYACAVGARNEVGCSAFHFAGTPEDVAFLVAALGGGAAAAIEAVNEQGLTPLLHHCRQGTAAVAHALLEAGADAGARDLGRRNGLHLCGFRGLPDTAARLLATSTSSGTRSAPDPSAPSLRLNTPLHAAAGATATAGDAAVAVARLLLSAGADPARRNAFGLRPADLAAAPAARALLENYALVGPPPRPSTVGAANAAAGDVSAAAVTVAAAAASRPKIAVGVGLLAPTSLGDGDAPAVASGDRLVKVQSGAVSFPVPSWFPVDA